MVSNATLCPGCHVRYHDGWRYVEDVWNVGRYDDLVSVQVARWTLGLNAIRFMTRVLDVKMFKVETVGGRCGVFGSKTVFFSGDGKQLKTRRLEQGASLLCLEVRREVEWLWNATTF